MSDFHFECRYKNGKVYGYVFTGRVISNLREARKAAKELLANRDECESVSIIKLEERVVEVVTR